MTELTQVTQESARGGLFLFSGATLGSIILAVSAIIMGRLLGPELYGQYTLVLVVPTLLLLFTDLGINSGVTKFCASLRTEGKSWKIPLIYRYGLIARLGIGIIISIVSIIYASYFALLINRPDLVFFVQLASLSVIFQVIFTTSNSAFVGLDKSEYSALVTTLRAILTSILQIALVILGYNLAGALFGFVAGYTVASIIGLILLSLKFLRPLRANNANDKIEDGKATLKILASYGMPVYLSVVLVGLFPLYQQVVLAFFVSDAQIGNFRAAYNFVSLFLIISTALTTALLPAFSKLENQGFEKINIFFNKANKFTCLLLVPITVLVIVLSEPIVLILYGSVYSSAALFLSLNCSIYLLSIIGYMTLTSVFNGLGKTRLTLNTTLISFVILLFLSPMLAQCFGVVGAIMAYLISVIIASIYAANIATRYLKIKFKFRINLKIYAICTLAALPCIGLSFMEHLSSFSIAAIGIILYLFILLSLLPLLRVINIGEISILIGVTKRIPVLNIIAKPIFWYERKILSLIHN